MVKTLHIRRHAQRADRQPGQPAKNRKLTLAGMKDANKIGNAIKKINIRFDLVMGSKHLALIQPLLIIVELTGDNPALTPWSDQIYFASG
jgi:phosphohistidine phosphatase SixA